MRDVRVAPCRQLALDVGEPSGEDRWNTLPEQARLRVLALLAVMIAQAPWLSLADAGPAVGERAGRPPGPGGGKITAGHRSRDAVIYVRQSTFTQSQENTESLALQYELRRHAAALGWGEHQINVIDEDLARSAASSSGRLGFTDLVAAVGLGKAGIIIGREVSRLARNNTDWYQVLDLCSITDTLIDAPMSCQGTQICSRPQFLWVWE
jgi:hypothetical protein